MMSEKFGKWTLFWTGWKQNYCQIELVGQWYAIDGPNRVYIASHPGTVAKYYYPYAICDTTPNPDQIPIFDSTPDDERDKTRDQLKERLIEYLKGLK
jgi:hypothetical protein